MAIEDGFENDRGTHARVHARFPRGRRGVPCVASLRHRRDGSHRPPDTEVAPPLVAPARSVTTHPLLSLSSAVSSPVFHLLT